MKKNLKLAVLFCLILTVLASAFAFSASALKLSEEQNKTYRGEYAADDDKPVIDGEIDEVWNTTPAMPFGKAEYGYIKVLWNGVSTKEEKKGTLYLLAVVNDCEEVDFVISTRFYNYYEDNKSATWDWAGNFGIHVDADTDSSASGYKNSTKADFLSDSNLPKKIPEIKTKATETGFVAEIAFDLNNANAAGFKKGGFFGIGAFVNGDYTTAENAVGMDVEHITEGSYYIYALYMNQCSHSKTNPATCKTGKTCADCGKVLDNVLDPTNHVEEAIWVKTDEENHHKFYPCCGTSEADAPHEWSEKKITDKEPTCTEPGEESFHCVKCGAKKDVGVLNALGHKYDDNYKVVKEPDCVNTGYKTRKCIRCGEGEIGEEIPALGHDFSEDYKVDVEPDCTNTGSKSKHCSRCDAKDDVQEIPALGHEYDDNYKVVKEPDCVNKGYETRKCVRCEEGVDGKEIPPLGHDMVETERKEADCLNKGYESRHCTRCDEGWIPALGHDFAEDYTEDLAPDCTNTGSKSKHCSRCDAKDDVQEIPALGHEYDDNYKVVKEPDCVNAGYKTRKCIRCGEGEVGEEIPALGHDFAKDYTVDVQPTCMKAGSASRHCTRCNEKGYTQEIAARGHISSDWIIDEPATPTKDGKRHRVCEVCGATLAKSGIYYGVRGTVEPNIDGNIDEVWNDAPELWFGNAEYGYIKVLWRENTLYLLAVVNGCEQVDLIVSTRFYNNVEKGSWTWGGNYGLNIKADTDSTAPGYVAITTADFLKASQAAKKAIVKARATENGFVAEVKLSLSGEEAAGCKLGGMFGIGAFVNGEYTAESTVGFDVENMKTAAGYIYATYMGCPHKNLKSNTAKCTGTTCADCGKVNESAVDLTKHAKAPVWKTDENNPDKCYRYYPCCGLKEEEVEHEWNAEKTVDKAATCTETGVKSTHCKNCKASKGDSEEIPALGHNWSTDYTIDKEPTCEESGFMSHHCTRCKEADDSDKKELAALGHDFSKKYTVDKAATCTENGSESRHCKNRNCNATIDPREISALGHDFAKDYTEDVAPDCTNKGSKSKHCSRCDAKDDVQEIPALGHDFPEEYTVDTAATCTKSGSESRHCTRCDATTDTREIPAAGHKWSDWTTVAAATCKKPGARHKTCMVCYAEGEVETVTVPHTAGEWIIDKEAAPGVAGKRHHVCTVCKAVFDEEEIPALPVADTDNKTTDTDSHPYAVIGCKGSLTATAGTVGVLLLPLALVVCGKRRKERESE